MTKSKLNALVHAIIHKADETKREKFYECINKNWSKIHEHGLSTTWATTVEAYSYDEAFKLAMNSFLECANKCNAKIDFVVQIGPYPAKIV